MTSLTEKLSDIVGAVFEAEDLPKDLGQVFVSDRPDLAQFQCNGALAAAKQAKKNPREIAQTILERLQGHDNDNKNEQDVFAQMDIAGPGFINFNISDSYLEEHLIGILQDERQGVPVYANDTVVLDYGGANIAKHMHVGHLRAAIIGESLRRVVSFAGYQALGDVHLGDWGTHMGMLIADYINAGEESVVLDTALDNENAIEVLMQDMAERYPKASSACKADEKLMKQAQETTVKLQSKESPYYDIWQKIRDVSVEAIKKTYGELGVSFDLWKGEADVHDYIKPMVEDLKKGGWANESEGAWIVPVEKNDDTKEMPPLILYKRDGAVMYGTTDMATLVERMKLYNPSKVIYIVDQRQSLHFEQVFRAVRLGGIVPDTTELTHAGFGTMNGTDGKPFKTREGGIMRLEDLIAMAKEKAAQRLAEANLAEDMDEAERADVGYKVAIAAIKFADLQNQRHADYIFDLDRLTKFEGKTGPYLLYQAVRIQSLLKKAGIDLSNFSVPENLTMQEEDRPLALFLTEFTDYFDACIRNYAPHHLCEYAYKLSQHFSSFYNACHILSEEDEAIKTTRLALCVLTFQQLQQTLSLLGIEIPERM